MLSVGLGLPATAAVAAPPPPVTTDPPPVTTQPPPVVTAPPGDEDGGKKGKPGKLQKALLSKKQVPKGYVEQDGSSAGEMFAGMLAGYRLNADPCAAPPARTKDAVTAKPDVKSATVLFLNEKKSMVVVEMLAETGEAVAVDMVDDTETVLDECPLIRSKGTELEMEPLDWNPLLGDQSVTVGMRFEVTEPGREMTMVGKMAFVAYRDLSLTVGLIGINEPSERDLKNVVRAAVRKVVLNTPISGKDRM